MLNVAFTALLLYFEISIEDTLFTHTFFSVGK